MLVDNILKESTAFIASWLPGTSGGQGILDSITGDYTFKPTGTNDRRNTLSIDWPSNMVIYILFQESLANFPVYSKEDLLPRISDALFQVGYGLSNAPSDKKDMQLNEE